jgi:uncharacterized membrane protein
MKLKAAQFFAIMLFALVTGVFWGTWFSLSRSISSISPETFLEIGKAFIRNLAIPMSILMPVSILSGITALLLTPDKKSPMFHYTLAGCLLMVVAMIITLSVNVPIDNKIKVWTLDSLPSDWGQIRDHWERFHALRTFVSVASLGALVIAALHGTDRKGK